MPNIKLLADRVLVKVPEETKTSSGLVVSRENDASNFKQGTVVAVGKGNMNDQGIIQSLEVKLRDEIMFSYGEQVLIEKEKYFLIKESDIAMIINVDKGTQNKV